MFPLDSGLKYQPVTVYCAGSARARIRACIGRFLQGSQEDGGRWTLCQEETTGFHVWIWQQENHLALVPGKLPLHARRAVSNVLRPLFRSTPACIPRRTTKFHDCICPWPLAAIPSAGTVRERFLPGRDLWLPVWIGVLVSRITFV